MQSSEPPFNRAAPVRHFLLSRGAPPLFTARLGAPVPQALSLAHARSLRLKAATRRRPRDSSNARAAGAALGRIQNGASQRCVSRRFDPCGSVDGFRKLAPGVALRLQHLLARRRQPVVAAAALSRFFYPAALNPPALLEAIQQRVERGDAKLEDSLRARLNELAEVVAMPRLILDEREDQQLGAALFQLPIQHLRLDVLHSDILLKGM